MAELQIQVSQQDGNVVLIFPAPLEYFALTPAMAVRLGQDMIDRAAKLAAANQEPTRIPTAATSLKT